MDIETKLNDGVCCEIILAKKSDGGERKIKHFNSLRIDLLQKGNCSSHE